MYIPLSTATIYLHPLINIQTGCEQGVITHGIYPIQSHCEVKGLESKLPTSIKRNLILNCYYGHSLAQQEHYLYKTLDVR